MKGFTTKIVHSDRLDVIEHGSLHKPVHATVAYGYEDARDLAAVFQGRQAGFTYGRQVNPTVEALQSKISTMEDGLQSVCFSTGMAAIGTMLFAEDKTLHLDLIAEGVENRTQLRYLHSLGCSEVQGFIFSGPVPAAEAAKLLRQDPYRALVIEQQNEPTHVA